jgi:dTDP-glucose 4,6-dehydratase
MNNYQPKIMLVTGGAGFIGSNFVRHVLQHEPNIKIINLDKLTYAGSLNNLQSLPDDSDSRHLFIQGDITDAGLVKKILKTHIIDTIVHFAAESHVDRSISSPIDFIHTNIIGTFTLLEAAQQFSIQRFHHISTDEVYGSLNLQDPFFTEKTAYQPRSPYSASKAGSDHLVMAYFHTYQLPITISNCSNNYGPYQHAEKFIPTIIQACLQKKPIPIYGNGKNIRDWLYVEDHCSAIMRIIKKGKIGENYNIGGNNEWENTHLARYICEKLDHIMPHTHSYTDLITFVTDRMGHDLRYAIDNSKITAELDWQPQENLETGMAKTIEFYLKTRT